MKYSHLFYLPVISGMLLFSGCHKEIYDPGALERDYFIQNIPDNFDWSTTKNIDLQVIPYDRHDGKYDYTIDIFARNPLIHPDAALYATGWGRATHPFRKVFTIPAGDSLLFIRQTSPGGRQLMRILPATSSTLNCNFNPQPTGVRSKASAIPAGIKTEIPATAIAIEGNQDITLITGNKYVITTTYTGRLTFPREGNCDLYIKGTWVNPAEQTILEQNSNIYILQNGKLLSDKNCTFIFTSAGPTVSIAKGGQFGNTGENNITLLFQNYGSLLNAGSLYCNRIYANSAGHTILNQGKFYANEVSTADVEFSFRNECYSNIGTLLLANKASLYIAPECALICTALGISNATVQMDNHALLEATTLTSGNWGRNLISGQGDQPSLCRLGSLVTQGNQWSGPMIFDGNLYLACQKWPSDEGSYRLDCITEKPGNGPYFEITASECTKGNDYTEEVPVQPEFPKTVSYTQSYTYASEDNFPTPGDYDMNDLVISIDSVTSIFPEKDKISETTWHITLHAVGATRLLGAAIQLDAIRPNEVESVLYDKDIPRSKFEVNSNQTEKDQQWAVIPLFDNAHLTLGSNNIGTIINTISRSTHNLPPLSFRVKIKFSSPVEASKLDISKLNYFVIVGIQLPRTEIHHPAFVHTDLSQAPLILQKNTEKFMWTIQVPGTFRYPYERVRITKAYTGFEQWVQSGGTENPRWYENPDTKEIY